MNGISWDMILAVIAPLVGGLVWLVRLEGRIKTMSRIQDDCIKRKDVLDAELGIRLEKMTDDISVIKALLGRIDERLPARREQ